MQAHRFARNVWFKSIGTSLKAEPVSCDSIGIRHHGKHGGACGVSPRACLIGHGPHEINATGGSTPAEGSDATACVGDKHYLKCAPGEDQMPFVHSSQSDPM